MKNVLKNGKIYTADESNPWAEAVIVEDGVISYVGSNDCLPCGADFTNNADCTVFDLNGRFVMPGLIDAHTHMGLSVMIDGDDDSLPIYDCKSKTEILEKLRELVKRKPFALYYVMFFGQVEALGEEGLNRSEIDEIVKARPVILLEQECHSAWLNSGAMKFLKIREDIEDMAPGYSYYERDDEGKLTGCIKEMTMMPILKLAGNVSDKQMKVGLLKIANYLIEHGITTVYDAGNYLKEENTYKILTKLDKEGLLPIRVEATHIITRPEMAESAIDEFKRLKSLYTTKHIKFKTIKLMLDGTHRIHTAKMVKPYEDTGTTGGTMLSEEKLYHLIRRLNEEKIDFHIHTVGEGASKMVLDCVEKVKIDAGKLDIIITLAHLETQRDEDIPRFKELGIVGNFTPHWHGGVDYGTPEATEKLLGEYRARNLMRAKTMVGSGATVTFSSDEVSLALLERWNPFLGIEIGHTRQELGRKVFPPEEEKLSIEDLIRGYTINAAYALRLDDRIGSIEVGKSADMVVLREDLFTMNPYDIHKIIPEAVIVEGKIVKGALSCCESVWTDKTK